MSLLLRMTVGLSGASLIFMAVRSVVTRQLSEQQGYFWIFSGLGIIIFGAFPGVSAWIAQLFDVEYIPSIVFMIAIIIAIYGIFNCFQAIANLNKRVQELAMQVSLLNHENNSLLKAYKDMAMSVSNLKNETDIERGGIGN